MHVANKAIVIGDYCPIASICNMQYIDRLVLVSANGPNVLSLLLLCVCDT